MNGLKDLYKDKKKRYKIIVEKCLYFCDINPTNIFVCKLLIDPYNEYKINYHEGNTLELDIKEKFNIDGFDAVIGNPPYNDASNNKGSGHKIWDKFMKKSIEDWLIKKGYLLYVHPPLWRQYKNKLFDLVRNNNLIYLEIHDEKDGIKQFKCATRYDWYLLRNNDYNNKTIIIDEYGNKNIIDINKWKFIPNSCFNELKKIIDMKNPHEIIHSESAYEKRKKWINDKKNKEYKYPVIYSIYKDKSTKKTFSNRNDKGHYGISKVIFTPNLGLNNILDEDGKYGLSQWVVGITGKPDELKNISKIFTNTRFKKLLKSIKFGMYYNKHILRMFKKDFWKEFIDE